jgi:hypothetical protein
VNSRGLQHYADAPDVIGDASCIAGVQRSVLTKVRDWLASSAKSPKDKIMKERLKGLLAS